MQGEGSLIQLPPQTSQLLLKGWIGPHCQGKKCVKEKVGVTGAERFPGTPWLEPKSACLGFYIFLHCLTIEIGHQQAGMAKTNIIPIL